mmetsp:Transcript_3464/g.8164  ORF Transcript_3464/g.8164 Transcript_3464/m.8164 type:complete len:463 (+) Transcript_3464:43-1431(+)
MRRRCCARLLVALLAFPLLRWGGYKAVRLAADVGHDRRWRGASGEEKGFPTSSSRKSSRGRRQSSRPRRQLSRPRREPMRYRRQSSRPKRSHPGADAPVDGPARSHREGRLSSRPKRARRYQDRPKHSDPPPPKPRSRIKDNFVPKGATSALELIQKREGMHGEEPTNAADALDGESSGEGGGPSWLNIVNSMGNERSVSSTKKGGVAMEHSSPKISTETPVRDDDHGTRTESNKGGMEVHPAYLPHLETKRERKRLEIWKAETHFSEKSEPSQVGSSKPNITMSPIEQRRMMALPKGHRVLATKLLDQPERNFQYGSIISYHSPLDKYEVLMDPDAKLNYTVLMKQDEFCQRVDNVEIHHLKLQTGDLNKNKGTISRWLEEEGRYEMLMLDGPLKERFLYFLPHHVKLAKDTYVKIRKLQRRVHLNGLWGKIVRWHEITSRYEVDIGTEVIHVRPEKAIAE